MIHPRREQRKSGAETAPHKVVARQHAGRILRVRVGEVIEHGLEKEEGADGEEAGADDGHDPVDAQARRPAEPKKTDGYAKSAHESGREAFLRFDLAVVVELRLDYLVEVIEERGHDEDGAEEDANERETFLAQIELVDADEDDGEGFEPDVQETVDEGDVQIEEEDHWFCKVEGDGPDESDERDLKLLVILFSLIFNVMQPPTSFPVICSLTISG